MKNFQKIIIVRRRIKEQLCLLVSLFLLCSCASVDPATVTIRLGKTTPKEKITSYTQSLRDLGLMTEIYASDILKIQSNPINDKTGTSGSTGGEVPRDITEMLKSALNSIGGNVVYIPYDPAFLQNQMVTGYSEFAEKVIPDVILSGGITEFDRGLETRGENTDLSLGGELRGISDQLPSRGLDLRYGEAEKRGLARITLDFNLLDFRTMTGIPRMSAVNTMEVKKGLRGNELGISIFGQSFGRKGDIKRVQGRHNAVRLLVELSMIQIVGKYGVLPYWRLLGDDAAPDKDVEKGVSSFYHTLGKSEIIRGVQEWLFLHGYDLYPTGELDEKTRAALGDLGLTPESNEISLSTFKTVYYTIPVNEETLRRRNRLGPLLENRQGAETEEGKEGVDILKTKPATEKTLPSSSEANHKKVIGKKRSIGRFLTDEEW